MLCVAVWPVKTSWFNQFMSCSFLPPYFFISRNTTHPHTSTEYQWKSACGCQLSCPNIWIVNISETKMTHRQCLPLSTVFSVISFKGKVKSKAHHGKDWLVMFWWNISNLSSHQVQLVVIAEIAFCIPLYWDFRLSYCLFCSTKITEFSNIVIKNPIRENNIILTNCVKYVSIFPRRARTIMDFFLFFLRNYMITKSRVHCSVNNTRTLCPHYKQYHGLSTAISDQVKDIYYPQSIKYR